MTEIVVKIELRTAFVTESVNTLAQLHQRQRSQSHTLEALDHLVNTILYATKEHGNGTVACVAL
mgnify:CR=1 FL=1